MKIKTVGASPKVPVQALTTLIVGALAYFGVDLSVEVSGALAVVIGFAAGYIAPAAPVAVVPERDYDPEGGQSLVGVLIAILLAALAYWLCVALGLPVIIGVIAAIVVLLAAVGGVRRY